MSIRLVPLMLAATMVVAACGDDDDTGDSAPAAATAEATAETPATTSSGGRGDYGESPSTATSVPAGGDTSLQLATTDLGDVITAGDGFTLYIFMPDNAGAPTCLADCAANWPPELADGTPSLGDGIDAAMVGTVDNPEGGSQITYNGWPLYRFAADAAAGDTNGQGQGGVWFVIGSDGEPIQ